jgi:hypothetical protein
MSDVTRVAQWLRRELDRFDVPADLPDLSARAKTIDAVAAALEQRRTRKRRAAWLGAVAAAAALVTVGALASRVIGTEPAVLVGVTREVPRAVSAGDRFELPADREGVIRFPTGTQVDLAAEASVAFEALGASPKLRLGRGALVAHVAKLRDGEAFRVVTADVEIEVKGTVFSVELAADSQGCDVATTTRLRVEEGKVWLRHRDQRLVLSAGQSWPDCRRAAAPTPAPLPAALPSPPPPAEPIRSYPPLPVRASSKLPQQNDAFESAGAALRRGEADEAARRFTRFRVRFPRSPLAEDATVELMRLYQAQGGGRAGEEARLYLQRWPQGYARDEAQGILRGR